MTYVDRRREMLEQELPTEPPDLLDLYLLLALRRGTQTTAEDVHDAWAIWRSRTRADHPSIVPFDELDLDVQQLDNTYVDAIHKVAP